MEGPSLKLAQAQLKPFIGQRILHVAGNTTIGKERLSGQVLRDLFAWGKHLVLQCDGFALRVHFLLFGTYEAEVDGRSVTGDYTRSRTPRLALTFPNGALRLYTCSVLYIEGDNVKRTYDHHIDVLARQWDPQRALAQLKAHAAEEIGDVLLDQTVFAGVGNIIKNEVLALTRLHPSTAVRRIPAARRKALIAEVRAFSLRFLRWRRAFSLRKHLLVYGRGTCPHCGGKLVRAKTGVRQRWSYWCPRCQPLAR